MKNAASRTCKLLCTLLLLPCATAMALDDPPTGGDPQQGKALFYAHACYSCHGYGGVGRTSLANNVSAIMSGEAVFLAYLRARDNINPPLPSQRMPSFSRQSLPDEDALHIYAYIRTLKDTPPPLADIPALQGVLEGAVSSSGQTSN